MSEQIPPEGQDQGRPHAMFRNIGADASTIAAAAQKRVVATSQVLVVIVAIVGGGSIYWMRQMGMRSGMDFDARPVSFKSEFSHEDQARFQQILHELELGDLLVQIPSQEAGSNPFFLGIVKPDQDAENAREAALRARERAAADALRAREAQQKQISDALGRMRLGTIITGRVPLATINDEIVKVGDDVMELFQVVDITSQAVTLEAQGERYVITPQTNGPGAGR